MPKRYSYSYYSCFLRGIIFSKMYYNYLIIN